MYNLLNRIISHFKFKSSKNDTNEEWVHPEGLAPISNHETWIELRALRNENKVLKRQLNMVKGEVLRLKNKQI